MTAVWWNIEGQGRGSGMSEWWSRAWEQQSRAMQEQKSRATQEQQSRAAQAGSLYNEEVDESND